MYRRRRWVAVIAAVLFIAAVELLSDSVLDSTLQFPLDTLLVVAVASIMAFAAASLAFAQIDRLARGIVERNSELESRNAALRAVYDVSLAVSGQADPQQTIATILDRARDLLHMDAAVLVVDGPAGELRLAGSSAAPGVMRGDREAESPARGSDPDRLDSYLQPGYEVRVSAPVVLGDKRVGTLGLASRSPRHLSAAEIGTVSALGTQVGLALEAARLHDELQALAVQGERERIAREMHDGLAQVLAYVNTKSQAVDEMLADGRVAEARQQLGQLTAAARSLYVDVREAILTLSSPVPPERGLAAALEQYAALYAESSKLAVRFETTPEAAGAPLSSAVQAEVFRIAREALTNVRKHARAQRVGLSMSSQGREIVLRIQDDGVGFEAEVLARGPERWPHFGLAGMRERAESVGGSISWQSTLGAGTTIELRVPVGASSLASPPDGAAPHDGTGRPAAQHQAVRSATEPISEAD
jgi:two-component system nitrate/nitrite sensor histidine kinase NarX